MPNLRGSSILSSRGAFFCSLSSNSEDVVPAPFQIGIFHSFLAPSRNVSATFMAPSRNIYDLRHNKFYLLCL